MNTVPLIGRSAESAAVDRFYEMFPSGSRSLLLVGEVGIGKTTQLNWGRSQARSLGYQVLSASPAESEFPLEFASLADLLENVPRTVLDELPDPQRRAIGVAVFRDQLPEEPVDPRTLATAVLGTLRRLATDTPVVLAIDDLPWLDLPSARVLSFVLRRAGAAPLGLLATVRIEWSMDRAPLVTDPVDADLVERVRVGPMSAGEIGQLLVERTGLSLGRARLRRLQELSRGNPLFALELVEANAVGGADRFRASADVPKSLRRLVKSRIGHLPPGSRDVLLVAALSGESELSVVVAGATDPLHAAASFERVVEAGIVVRRDGGFTFAHPLIRSVVIDDAPSSYRRRAHQRLASVVRPLEERARHLALGADGPNEQIAQEVEEAAMSAAGRGACDTAAALAELAVTLTPSDFIDVRHRRMALEADYHFVLGDPVRACELIEGVIDNMPAGPSRAELLRRLARYLMHRGDPVTTRAAKLALALEESGNDLTLRATILVDALFVMSYSDNLTAADSYVAQAVTTVEVVGDEALAAQLYAALARMSLIRGEGLRHDLIERALQGPDPAARLAVELRPNVVVGHLLRLVGDLSGARDLYERENARARQEGVDIGLPFILGGLVQTETAAGNWGRAEELGNEAFDRAEESGSLIEQSYVFASTALLRVCKGRLEEGRRDAHRSVQLAGVIGMPVFVQYAAEALGLAELSIGDAAAAHRTLEPIVGLPYVREFSEPSLLRFIPDYVEALIRLGEIDAAAELLDPFESRSNELGRTWGMATSGRCRALLQAASGSLEAAETTLRIALEHHAGLAMPFEHGRTLLVAGEVHRRARHKTLANGHLQSALEIFESLGAPLWAERTRAEIDRIGLRRATPESGLTAIESRVADLAASGLTNAQIATRMFISPRTVEAHLSRIYRKLGVTSRTAMSRAYIVRPPEGA
jgi:DNA-binding CsgD family transcriptional regulator